MSNFFERAVNDLDSLEQEILGPDYPYYKYIKSPSEMGMSSDGKKIAHNIGKMIAYSELLVTGKSDASKTGGPLGNKFFLKTGAKCKDTKTGKLQTRSLYINNVPDGDIPLISSMTGRDFTEFEGLVPGTLSDMSTINPLAIFQAFMIGNEPDCQEIEMETIDTKNVKSKKKAYVVKSDIRNMNPCWFPERKNPISNESCKEAFTNIQNTTNNKGDYFIKIYYSALGLLGLYIFMKLYLKK